MKKRTSEEILRGNQLIAEFMPDMELYTPPNFHYQPYWRQFKDGMLRKEIPPIRLNYHISWNMLMPVVEKIADTPMEDFIVEGEDGGYAYPTTFGMRDENGEWMVRFRGHGLYTAATLREAVWEACVDFINSHNDRRKANS